MTPTTFRDLGVPARLVAALENDGKVTPFPVQTDTLPDTLAGRDVLGRGKTGSGKTLAFSIPLVARLGEDAPKSKLRPGQPRGLVLAPTRELATQIASVLEPLAAAYNMRITTIFGGVSQNRQVQALSRGVDIVVACPGRLEDLMRQGFVLLDGVTITVLDEADHMADLGFLPDVTRILEQTPKDGQRLLFSATLDNGVRDIVRKFLTNEVLHTVDDAHSHVTTMTHHVVRVNSPEMKRNLVHALAAGTSRRILFVRTKHLAKKLSQTLNAYGVPAVDLHGDLTQAQRNRNLGAFGDGRVNVLVATDVAARGVHVDNVELVVHVDPPVDHKAYLHRSGRTARAGSGGKVITLCLPLQEKALASLLRRANIVPSPVTDDDSDYFSDFTPSEPKKSAPATSHRKPPRAHGRSSGNGTKRPSSHRSPRPSPRKNGRGGQRGSS